MMRAYDQGGADLSNCSLSNVAYGSKIQNISTGDGSNQIEFVLCTATFPQQYRANIQLSNKTIILQEDDTLYGPIDGYNIIAAKSLAGYYFFYLENQVETQMTQHLHKISATSSDNMESNQQGQNNQQQGQENQRPQANQGTAASSDSGSVSLPKLSKQEIIDLLNSAPTTTPDDAFLSMPSCTAPYETGKIRQNVLNAAATRLSALRRIAGLPAVTADPTLCEQAQYGAVILGKLGTWSHTPNRPADMDQIFYQKAYDATSTSNVYVGMELLNAMDMFMDDSNVSNISRVGHRRWQLSTSLGKVGFGYVHTDRGGFTVEKVFDKSNPCTDYNYVSWPASGYFPNDLSGFGSDTAWSVSLNPQYYSTPVKTDITVTLTRESDGRQWALSGRQSYQAANSGEYFNIQPQSWEEYGGNHCIIFRPDGIDKYEGVYTVDIQGLQDAQGTVVGLNYQVDFFPTKSTAPTTPATPTTPTQPTNPATPTTPTQPTTPATPTTPTQPTTPAIPTTPTQPMTPATPTTPTQPTNPITVTFTDVKNGDWFKHYVEQVAEKGWVNGYDDGRFGPNDNVTYAQLSVMLTSAFYKDRLDSYSGSNATWYTKYCTVANDLGLFKWTNVQNKYTDNTHVNKNVNRYEMAQIIYHAMTAAGIEVDIDLDAARASTADWVYVPDQYRPAVAAAKAAGLISGIDGNGTFGGDGDMTRAQAAVVLCKLDELVQTGGRIS